MIYVMSDLHGRFDLYEKMLDRIGLKSSDTLYILGDVLDRGDEGFRIVLDIADRENVIPIMGNHDFLALSIIPCLERGFRPGQYEDMRYLIDSWKMDGGQESYREYKNLSASDRSLALMTLDSFRNFAEVGCGSLSFVLCHGGIKDYNKDRPLTDYTVEDFAFYREDYSKAKFSVKGRFLVTGHTPTAAIEGAQEGRIYRNRDHIAIDCGAVFGYGLGCLCLDTMEEIYVK